MKLTPIAALLRAYFRHGANATSFPGNVFKVPAGIAPDAVGAWGVFGLMANIDAIDWDLIAIVSSATTLTLTGAQFFNQIIDHSGSPGSGVTVTTPTALQIIAACPNTIPQDGYNFPLFYMNDGTGQTITLSGGTNVTITGNNTMSTNTCRHFMVNVNVNAGTVTMVNFGTVNL